MPAGYEKIRDSLKKKGMSLKSAKKHAAMIWNSSNKGKGNTVGKGRS
jgi:hypothetical protein